MKYTIYHRDPHKKFIHIDLTFDTNGHETIDLQLAAWRPGRYELQNYSRNIQQLTVFDEYDKPLAFKKIGKEKWYLDTKNAKNVKVQYRLFAYQMDAGGCWIDEEQLYVNFIYCLLYIADRENNPCSVELKIPADFKIGCGLLRKENVLLADSYGHLVDSPCIAGTQLKVIDFAIGAYKFNICWIGENQLEWHKVKNDFILFCTEQIKTMGGFPEPEYFFLYQFLPYRQHHGVEHRNSTIITLGPAELVHCEPYYLDFLSISSHELFHSWNIAKIRPVEMLPYDLTKENYFESGFIVEGVTTYYGEYFLIRAGVITQEEYFNELNIQFKKHFENFGNYNLSIANSSMDLWVDGYVGGIPNRKVSIYVKGAVIALILDLEIRKITSNKYCLDDVMISLWNDLAKNDIGYSINDYRNIIESITKTSFEDYFDECVYGTTDVRERVQKALEYVGCMLQVSDSRNVLEKVFGLRILLLKDGRTVVDTVEPGSPADAYLFKDDELIVIDNQKINSNANDLAGRKTEIVLGFFRKSKLKFVTLRANGNTYYNQTRIAKNPMATIDQKENYKIWLKNIW